MTTKITNANLVLPNAILPADLIYTADRITAIGGNTTADRTIDARGGYICPGFIDLHLHGGAGHDFIDGTTAAYEAIARFHLSQGTTTSTPTILSARPEEVYTSLEAYNSLKHRQDLGFAGIHMEGPYFAYSQRGAQDPSCFLDLSARDYERFYTICPDIVRWSAAPELEDTDHFASFCRDKKIRLSIAHSGAMYGEIERAREDGWDMFTHLYSGMTTVQRIDGYRIGGAVEAALLLGDMYTETIADLKHLPAELLRLVHKVKGRDHNCLITDAMRATGQNVSESILGSTRNGQRVLIEQGVAWMPDKTAFAGSIATSAQLVRNTANAGIGLIDAVYMASTTPAKVLGREDIGSLEVGKKADIVVLNKELYVEKVIKNGEVVVNPIPSL